VAFVFLARAIVGFPIVGFPMRRTDSAILMPPRLLLAHPQPEPQGRMGRNFTHSSAFLFFSFPHWLFSDFFYFKSLLVHWKLKVMCTWKVCIHFWECWQQGPTVHVLVLRQILYVCTTTLIGKCFLDSFFSLHAPSYCPFELLL
jgi:hypothetical protein